MTAIDTSQPADFDPPTAADDGGPSAVHIENLNHAFGTGDLRQPVLTNIHLDIKPGELAILTGPSGSGKTTLVTLIGGLRSIQEGSVQVLGREMHGLDKPGLVAARRDIGFIFQTHNLLEALTAAENITLSLDLKQYTPEGLYDHAVKLLSIFQGIPEAVQSLAGVPVQKKPLAKALAVRLLEHFQVMDRAFYKPNQLSGGQKQRVAIARALINNPRLVLADEPTAALDRGASGVIIDLLKKLTQGGTTVIVVTHDQRVMDKGDRVVTLKDGKVDSNLVVNETVRIGLFLQTVSLFSTLTPGRLVAVAARVHKESYAPGAKIIRQGETAEKFYMIKEGTVSVLVDEGTGPRVVATMEPGHFFGEVGLLEDQPRNATIVANDAVDLYTLDKSDFLHAYQSFQAMRDELVKVLSQRSRRDLFFS